MTAPAMRPRDFVQPRPRQRVMAPFAGDAVAATHHLAIDHDAAAAAGAEDDAEHHAVAGAGAIDGLGQREAVGVVLDAHLASRAGR